MVVTNRMIICRQRSRLYYASELQYRRSLEDGLTRDYRFQSKTAEEEDLEEERPKVRGSESSAEQLC